MEAGLEQRVRLEGADYGLFERSREAARWLREHAPSPARVRVIGDDDSDGVTSAHVLATAMRRAGHDVETVIRPLHTVAQAEEALRPEADVYMVADAGSTFLSTLDERQRPVMVFDHHTVQDHEPRHVFEVNPRRAAGDRTWQVSASVVSAVFAVALDPRNWDLAYAGVAGGVSDRQHLRGWSGLIGYCVEGSVRAGTMAHDEGLTLPGATLLEAVVDSIDPYFADHSGNAASARRLLEALGLPPAADPLRLGPVQARELAQRLTNGLPPGAVEHCFPLYGDRLRLRHASGAATIFHLSRLLEAATASDLHRTALMMLAGSQDARQQVETVARGRARRILDELARLRSKVHEASRFRWAETPDVAHTGVYGHVLLTFAFGDEKPVLVFGVKGDTLKASARGSPRLFLGRGLDLSVALPRAARAVGGHGGGHPGAAGADVPAARREEFLRRVDEELAALERSGPA